MVVIEAAGRILLECILVISSIFKCLEIFLSKMILYNYLLQERDPSYGFMFKNVQGWL